MNKQEGYIKLDGEVVSKAAKKAFEHFTEEDKVNKEAFDKIEQEWLNACAEEFRKYGCDEEESYYMAELALDSVDGDLSYDPVDCAQEEVSYWGE